MDNKHIHPWEISHWDWGKLETIGSGLSCLPLMLYLMKEGYISEAICDALLGGRPLPVRGDGAGPPTQREEATQGSLFKDSGVGGQG